MNIDALTRRVDRLEHQVTPVGPSESGIVDLTHIELEGAELLPAEEQTALAALFASLAQYVKKGAIWDDFTWARLLHNVTNEELAQLEYWANRIAEVKAAKTV